MAKYTVVTSVVGKEHRLIKQPVQDGVRYVCFTDDLTIRDAGWELFPACDKFNDYLNAKVHKILIHKYVDSQYTLWIDSRVEIKKSVEHMTDTFLKDHDIAVYNHSSYPRDNPITTIEEEMEACCTTGKDDPKRILEQYKKHEYPNRIPPVCSIIFRRNNLQMERLNEKWWSEICRYSVRDQLSFPYVFHEYYEIGGNMKEDFNFIV